LDIGDKVVFIPGDNPASSLEERTGHIVEKHDYSCPMCLAYLGPAVAHHWWVNLPYYIKAGNPNYTPSFCPISLKMAE
jgi:hypothetical protein